MTDRSFLFPVGFINVPDGNLMKAPSGAYVNLRDLVLWLRLNAHDEVADALEDGIADTAAIR